MGDSRWSDDDYKARVSFRAATSTPTFKYDTDIKSGVTSAVAHKSLDPKGVKIRESRDSAEHPESTAVIIALDVTGSMQAVPGLIQKNLVGLMGLLIRKGYLDHPQIMISAVGDATCDKVPIQVGQFESGIEIENDLTNLYLEGGGGGQQTESYELLMWFAANKTSMDCLEKRGKKGYLFLIGDENPYPEVKASEVYSVFGDKIQGNIRTESIVEQLKEKFEVFFVIPNMTSYYHDSSIYNRWVKLLGNDRVLKLQDPELISQLIGSTIGVVEGDDLEDVKADVKELIGESSEIVGTALATVARSTKISRKARGTEVSVTDSGVSSGIETL